MCWPPACTSWRIHEWPRSVAGSNHPEIAAAAFVHGSKRHVRIAMDLIIKNGTVVTAIDTYQADIGVKDGKIAQIGYELSHDPGARIVDAGSKYVFPGGVDTHVH